MCDGFMNILLSPTGKLKASTLLQFDSCTLRLRLYRHINYLLYINFILLRKVEENMASFESLNDTFFL